MARAALVGSWCLFLCAVAADAIGAGAAEAGAADEIGRGGAGRRLAANDTNETTMTPTLAPHLEPTAAPTRAVTKLHGAFKVQFPCARRGAGVLLNISAKLNSRPACRVVGYASAAPRRRKRVGAAAAPRPSMTAPLTAPSAPRPSSDGSFDGSVGSAPYRLVPGTDRRAHHHFKEKKQQGTAVACRVHERAASNPG